MGKRLRNETGPAKSLGQLQLNDFRGFNRYLRRKSGGRIVVQWSYYYDSSRNEFYPPIPYPVTEAEHQLDHYALWMVVYLYKLSNKPAIIAVKMGGKHPKYDCYACEYLGDKLYFCCKGCPIGDCRIYQDWCNAKMKDKPKIAHKFAMLEWKKELTEA